MSPGTDMDKPEGAALPPEMLVARCARLDLERLIVESIKSGTPVNFQVVEKMSAPADPAPIIHVGALQSIEGAGLFSILPLDAIAQIFNLLPLPHRLTCTIEVCKGLRALKSVPSMWSCINTSTIEYGYQLFESILWINGRGLLKLADWLADVSYVTDLSLHCSKGMGSYFAPDDLIAMLARFPHVERLTLTGQAIVKKILNHAAKTLRPNLRYLNIDLGMCGTDVLTSLIKQMPNLEAISCAQLSDAHIDGLESVMRATRGGGAPLLKSIRQTQLYGDRLSLSCSLASGHKFPELETLVLALNLQGPIPKLTHGPLLCANLRRLHIYRMVSPFGAETQHLSPSSLADLIRLLIVECPRLEALCLAHGRKNVGRGEVELPLPLLQDACHITPLPSTLVMLHLEEMEVQPEAFVGVALPQLTLLRLVECGSGAEAAADVLQMSCPKLYRDGIIVEPRGFRLEEGHPDRARLTAKVRHYPTTSLAGGLNVSQVVDVLESNGYYW